MSFERQKDDESSPREMVAMKNGTALNASINSNSDSFKKQKKERNYLPDDFTTAQGLWAVFK